MLDIMPSAISPIGLLIVVIPGTLFVIAGILSVVTGLIEKEGFLVFAGLTLLAGGFIVFYLLFDTHLNEHHINEIADRPVQMFNSDSS